MQDLHSGSLTWITLKDYKKIDEIMDEEEIFLGFEDNTVIEAKEEELKSWIKNNVFEEVEDNGQKAISTRWIVTEKIKQGKRICKARLVARGFEEDMPEWEKDAPTCNAETLKLCVSLINMKKWTCKTLDVKTAYLQGEKIKREVYLKPPKEVSYDGLWKLNKTVYGLKDAAKAWYMTVVKIVEDLGGKKCKLETNIFYWKDENDRLIGILCSHVDDFCYGGNEDFDKIMEKLKKIIKNW